MTELLLLKDFLKEKELYSDGVYSDFCKYYDLVQETNKVMNLTAITDKEEFQIKHFEDSLLPINEFKNAKEIADIGSGAGFPAIPLSIILKDVNFTLVDSLNKRVNFLNDTISTLGLENCKAVHSRAEDFAKEGREKFDVVTARAVASMNVLLEYLSPLCKVGGKIVAYKGGNAQEEITAASTAAGILGCKLEKTSLFTLSNGDSRTVAIYKKIKPCDKKYPRGGNKPKTMPL